MKKQIILPALLLIAINSFGQNTLPAPYNTGNIGIGTGSPGEKLHVAGTLKVDGSTGTGGVRVFQTASNAITSHLYVANVNNDRAFNFQLNTGGDALTLWGYNYPNFTWYQKFMFTKEGKFSAGTGTPLDQIHVFAESGANGITVTNPSTTIRAAITLENSTAARKFSFGTTGSADAAGSGNLVIRDATGNADRMTFHSNGKIGIATTNPAGYLHVKNTVVNNDIPTLLVENTSQGIYQNIRAQVNKVMKAENKAFVVENTMSTPGEVFKIHGDGRTKIGLSSVEPQALLHLYTETAPTYGYNLFIEENSTSGNGIGQTTRVKHNNTKAFVVENAVGTIYNAFTVLGDGRTLIGNASQVTMPFGYKLYVQTGILTEKIKVALSTSPTDWADYVFDKSYNLKSIEEVDQYIKKNKHLPGVPSTEELRNEGGIDLGKMDAKLMEKIEELTLYIIQLNDKNEKLNKRLEELEESK